MWQPYAVIKLHHCKDLTRNSLIYFIFFLHAKDQICVDPTATKKEKEKNLTNSNDFSTPVSIVSFLLQALCSKNISQYM